MIEVGAQLPAFSLRDTKREEVTDAAFKGSVSVFAFFPMAFTGG